MAEGMRFELTVRFCRTPAFQASAFNHSATPPHLGRPLYAPRRPRARDTATAPAFLCARTIEKRHRP